MGEKKARVLDANVAKRDKTKVESQRAGSRRRFRGGLEVKLRICIEGGGEERYREREEKRAIQGSLCEMKLKGTKHTGEESFKR
jgi:hypothetical protein